MESSQDSTSSGNGSKNSAAGEEKKPGGQRTGATATSRLHRPTAASEAKSKNGPPEPKVPGLRQPIRPVHGAGPRPPKPPGASRSQAPVAARGMQTPPSKPTSRIVSTPTSDEVTASDIALEAWDASEIHVANKTQAVNMHGILDQSVVPPVCKLGFDAYKTLKGKKPPPAVTTAAKIKPPLFSAMKAPPATVAKISCRPPAALEPEDPEDISEDLLDMAYSRYIQAKYLETMSKKKYDQTKQDGESALLSAWSLLEQTRQEYLRSEMECQKLEALAEVQSVLGQLEACLDTASRASGVALPDLEALAVGLSSLKHNLPVSGVTVDDGLGTVEALERLSMEYNRLLKETARPLDSSSTHLASSAAQACESMADSAGQCLLLAQDCDDLLSDKKQRLEISKTSNYYEELYTISLLESC